MTTIAYKAGVMAADSGAWIGDAVLRGVRKLARAEDGTLYGIAGSGALGAEFLRWVDEGRHGEPPKPTKHPNHEHGTFYVLVAYPDGRLRGLTWLGEECYDGLPYMAVGAGNVAALAAMYAGADAEEAIYAAIEHAGGAEGPVKSMKHEEPK